MGAKSAIEWTDATWNPWQGCHHVSPGCEHCYMFTDKKRYGQDPDVVVRSKPPTFNLPLKMKDPQRVFTCSWSDFFIKEADPWRDEAWAIIKQTPHLTYQILTKRVERAVGRLPWGLWERPWPNVQLIVSVENQEAADRRIPILLKTNVAVRGISAEPLLGPLDVSRWLRCSGCGYTKRDMGIHMDHGLCRNSSPLLDWVIVGGESSRVCSLEWIRAVRDQCRAAGVPVFIEQLGANVAHRYERGPIRQTITGVESISFMEIATPLKDKKGGDWSEWPEDLRVREFPR